MALEGQQGIVAQHAAAVVDNADQAPSAGFHFHANVGGAGIQGVFEKLFDHRSRPFHHFAGGDFVGDLVGKDADAAHLTSLQGSGIGGGG